MATYQTSDFERELAEMCKRFGTKEIPVLTTTPGVSLKGIKSVTDFYFTHRRPRDLAFDFFGRWYRVGDALFHVDQMWDDIEGQEERQLFMVALGNTYPIRAQLREAGWEWNETYKAWLKPAPSKGAWIVNKEDVPFAEQIKVYEHHQFFSQLIMEATDHLHGWMARRFELMMSEYATECASDAAWG